jgi:DnaJ family protein A protein 3
MVTQHVQGFFMQSTCSRCRCRGEGSYNKNPCMDCEGHGKLVQEWQANVNIPAGVENGQTLRMQIGKVFSAISFVFTRDCYFSSSNF